MRRSVAGTSSHARRRQALRPCLLLRGGAQLRCVVNATAGDETRFAAARPPKGERIAVIGAGPAGLTYASLVAGANTVTVFERDTAPGNNHCFLLDWQLDRQYFGGSA